MEQTATSPPRTRRRWWLLALVALVIVGLVVAFVLLRDRDSEAIPNEVVQGARGTVSDLRNSRYCEVLLVEGRVVRPQAAVYNTIGRNDCPTTQWESLDADAIKSEWGAIAVDLNGPRYWTIDAVEGGTATQEAEFGGIDMTLVAIANIPTTSVLRGGQTPYEPLTVDRTNVWWFDAGEPVYELVDPDGNRYRMQSYSQIVDESLSEEDLPGLGDRLDLPDGWTYEVGTPTQDEGVAPTDDRATILTDELRNTYQLTANVVRR